VDDPTTKETEGFGLTCTRQGVFYNARYYDPALGRFAQADSLIPAGAQGLDRYAYVNNSPVNFTDPSGHQMDEGDGGGDNQCPVQRHLECVNVSSSTDVSRDDLVTALGFLRDQRDRSAANGNVAGIVAAAIAGVPAGIIIGETCSAVIPCIAGVAIGTFMVSGSQQIASDLFGGTAASIYDDGVSAISDELMASSATTFIVTQSTYNSVDSKKDVITSNDSTAKRMRQNTSKLHSPQLARNLI